MDQIIIRTDGNEPDRELAALVSIINLLFPECRVLVCPADDSSPERIGDFPSHRIHGGQ